VRSRSQKRKGDKVVVKDEFLEGSVKVKRRKARVRLDVLAVKNCFC